RLLDYLFFFFNTPATTEIYTLSLHDALPIYAERRSARDRRSRGPPPHRRASRRTRRDGYEARLRHRRVRRLQRARRRRAPLRMRSEEHTSELQSLAYLVCRLLLEKKKTYTK